MSSCDFICFSYSILKCSVVLKATQGVHSQCQENIGKVREISWFQATRYVSDGEGCVSDLAVWLRQKTALAANGKIRLFGIMLRGVSVNGAEIISLSV
jgi:hypothetical protein